MWAFEHWNLTSPPDYMTFAKKMLSAGFYHSEETDMVTPYRHFNTYMGDPVRFILT
jgi:4-aminobutyrate aminotransferase / (S)-3-amino-2-methylpropionate transaminase